jgi:hypothetical protein
MVICLLVCITTTLLEIYQLVKATGKLDRFIIYGSYVTAKPEPNDVDIFLVMTEEFEVDELTGETRIIVGWQTKRDLSRRGIIEVTQ